MSEMMTFILQYLQNWSKQDKANIQYHITFKPVGEKSNPNEGNDQDLNQTNSFDTNCLVLFPCVFLIFNFIYWPMVIIEHLALKD